MTMQEALAPYASPIALEGKWSQHGKCGNNAL